MFLPIVCDTDQHRGSPQCRQSSIVESSPAPEPRPGCIESDQRSENNRLLVPSRFEIRTNGLGDAESPRVKRVRRVMLGKGHAVAADPRQVDGLAKFGREIEKQARRHLSVGRNVGQDGVCPNERGKRPQMPTDRLGRGMRGERRDCLSAPPERCPNPLLPAVHPALESEGTGFSSRCFLAGG